MNKYYELKPLLKKICPICGEHFTTKQTRTVVPVSHTKCYSTYRRRLAGMKPISNMTFIKEMKELHKFMRDNSISPLNVLTALTLTISTKKDIDESITTNNTRILA